jgi:hypothetical protein
MWTLYYRLRFFFHCLNMQLKAGFLRLGCYCIFSWHYIDNDSICTTGKVLKLNKIYAFKEGEYVDIVRLNDVYINKGYIYCSLYFFSKNKITTVCKIIQKDAYIIWRLMDNKEFDEIMSRRLCQQVTKQDDLLEFGY